MEIDDEADESSDEDVHEEAETEESRLEFELSNWVDDKIELWWDEIGCCCCCWQPGSNLCEPMALPRRTANMVA